MIITVVGLGLIGGSFCKAIKEKTEYTCLGIDKDSDVLSEAVSQGAIDGVCTDLSSADLTIVCLYPDETISFILDNKNLFKKDSVVIDACGIKSAVVSAVSFELESEDVTFIGAHPMAGREFSGFMYSLPTLFEGASFIMTPIGNVHEEKITMLSQLAEKLGFIKIVVSTPEEHDAVIAYTSQLAHIVSSAYIKSPTLLKETGFSAGSFKDLTRVAKLNENMWTTLFLDNKEHLLFEVNQIIAHLCEYRDALDANDSETLRGLLRDGRILKEHSLEMK